MQTAVLETPAPLAPVSGDQRHGKYLTFHLGREEFGIQVVHVREIMGLQDITSVPRTPVFLKGVINLRGKIIPVVDLRLKFGFEKADYTTTTCIIVVQVHRPEEAILMGLIVDSVSEVLSLTAEEIEDTPDFGDGSTAPHLLGIAKVKGAVKILLNIDHVLTAQELRGLDLIAGAEVEATVN